MTRSLSAKRCSEHRFALPRRLVAIAAAILIAGGAAGVFSACAGGASGRAAGSSKAARPGIDSLVLLHTNDTHAWLMPFKRDDGTLVGGAAARAALIERERESAPAAYVLDAGDVFQGTPFFNFFRGVPDYRAMALMEYEAVALGNHDLDDGPLAWIRAAYSRDTSDISPPPPYSVCANVFVAAESAWADGRTDVPAAARRGARWVGGKRVPDTAPLRYLAPPYHEIGKGDGPSIAFFGLMTRDLTNIVAVRPNGGVAVGDPVAVARDLVPKLRKHADVVICLSHMGLDADRDLAERVPGIDVIIGGHSHIALKKPILVKNTTPNGYHGTAIAQAGSRGEYLGRTVLYTENDRPVRFAGRLLSVRPADGESPRVAALLRPYADSIGAAMSKPVFVTPGRVPSTGLREGETPLGNFVADVIRDAVKADIAFINSGGIRAALPAGTVTVGDVYSVLPFDNRIVVVQMPGWRVRELLDFAGRRIGKGGFGQVSGVSFVIKGDRAGYIRVNGELIDSNRTYRVATIDYLYGGGDGYTIFEKAGPAEETGILLRDAAIRFLAEHPVYTFRKEGRIVWEGSMRGF